MKIRKVGVLVGSLRKESYSKKMAGVLKKLAPESLEMENIEIGSLEMYNQDFDDEGSVPASWSAFRDKVKKYDAILFITPEYNRSVPAVLKNALDVGSRPYGKSIWEGKPCAVVSVSPGTLGAFGANHHLRQSLVFLNMPAMQQPEAYIGNAGEILDENGHLTNEGTSQFLQTFMNSFADWIETISPKK